MSKSIFIAAPREMSVRRFTEIVKHYLPKGTIVLGISQEAYVVGFENQPQFKMLELAAIQAIVDKVANSNSPHKIEVLQYAQADLPQVLKSHDFARVLLVNGSWKFTFHNSVAYRVLVGSKIPFKFISPFASEDEAREYEASHTPQPKLPKPGERLSDEQMLSAANLAATQSFDYSFQTGTAIGRKNGNEYEFILTTFNKVIPYQTYALHHGNSRERNLTRPHDTNHYDTIHAEMMVLTEALSGGIDLAGATMFVNLLPCPNCARTLSQTDITEFVYVHDHSDGYAAKLFEMCGKKVRRVLP